MNIFWPRSDFLIVEDYFSSEQAAWWLDFILRKGKDPIRGFHHPHLRPNRFHKAPKYPVKKYTCFGLYWNPLDYNYHPALPEKAAKPFPIPLELKVLSQNLLKDFYPWEGYSPEAVMVNFYTKDSSMGLHVDKDEEDHKAPVIGLSFGSTCRFFFEDESGEMKDLKLKGNSIYIFGKTARLMRHGVGTNYSKSLSAGSENYLNDKERLNLTIRQVYRASE
jgi:DNA alkylation damage repair protein AlkB